MRLAVYGVPGVWEGIPDILENHDQLLRPYLTMARLRHDLPQDSGKLGIGDVGMLDVLRKDRTKSGDRRAGEPRSRVSSAATHFIGKIG